jgi:hypothetical protein
MKIGSTVVAAAAICLFGGAAMATEAPKYASKPKSVYNITPYVIPGENPGGNRTCEEVAKAFYGAPYYDGSFKSDAGDLYDYLPKWLKVTVKDGRYVYFHSTYPIGAVIVKGGPKANVYYYNNPVYHDNYLAAPSNASGKPAGLSNITFCWKKPHKPS